MASSRKAIERRGSARIAEALAFKIGHQGYDMEAITVNLSVSGALCRVERNIPAMTQLNVGLSLPAHEPGPKKDEHISAKGVVVRSERDPLSGKYLIAIYFSDLREKDRDLLQDYIVRRLAGRSTDQPPAG